MSDEDKEIKEKVLKFNSYDIFGFVVPGTVLALGILLHTKIFETNEFNKKITSDVFSLISFSTASWPDYINTVLLSLFFVYILGHIVALLSSAIIDKLLVERAQGYPFQHLFNKTIKVPSYSKMMKEFYKSILSLLMIPLIYLACKGMHHANSLLYFLPAGIMLIVKIIMSAMYLRHIDDQFFIRDRTDMQRRIADYLWVHIFKRSLKWFVWPYEFLSKCTLSALKMYKPFTEDFQKMFVGKFKHVFGLDPTKVDTEVHWLTYSYLCIHSPESNELIRHWLTMYGFARNLSVAFLILFFYNFILNENNNSAYLFWNVSTGLGFYLFLLRYYYLYYNYYSKYIFRAFVTHELSLLHKS